MCQTCNDLINKIDSLEKKIESLENTINNSLNTNQNLTDKQKILNICEYCYDNYKIEQLVKFYIDLNQKYNLFSHNANNIKIHDYFGNKYLVGERNRPNYYDMDFRYGSISLCEIFKDNNKTYDEFIKILERSPSESEYNVLYDLVIEEINDLDEDTLRHIYYDFKELNNSI